MALKLIYDFSTQPFSIGDVLSFQVMGNILCEQQGIEKFDMVLTYDPRQPVTKVGAFAHVTSGNFLELAKPLMDAASVSARVENVSLCTHDALPNCIGTATCWPSLKTGGYVFYQIMQSVLARYIERGNIPWLLLKKESNGDYVSVQLRCKPTDPRRDSNYDAWKDFFAANRDTEFRIVGDATERDAKLLADNVSFCKDNYSTVNDDLQTIRAAKFHMGATSGPCVVPMFNSKPYTLYNSCNGQDRAAGFTYQDGKGRFVWSQPSQFVRRERETFALLQSDFEAMQ